MSINRTRGFSAIAAGLLIVIGVSWLAERTMPVLHAQQQSLQNPFAPAAAPHNQILRLLREILSNFQTSRHAEVSTGLVYAATGDRVYCWLTNLGVTPITNVDSIIWDTSQGRGVSATEVPFQGVFSNVHIHTAPGLSVFRCEWKFDGLANSVRGTLQIVTPTDETRAVVDGR